MSTRTACVRFASLALLPAVLCLLATGCLRVKDTLTINPDGTGFVIIESVCYVPELAQMRSMGYRGESSAADAYPPLQKRDASILFPAADFTVTSETKTGAQGESTTVVKAAFKDVNRLLASPYANAHSLWMGLSPDGKTLTVKALSGFQSLADIESSRQTGYFPPEMTKKAKDNADKFRFDFVLNLPAPPKADSAVVAANSATWTVDRSVLKDSAKVSDALKSVMIASCSAQDIKFKPVSPLRLDLSTFAELAEGPVGDKPAAVDTAKGLASAKFLPLRFQSSRTFFFADESVGNRDGASLLGLVVLPAELAPQRWGKVKLTQAADDRGNDLLSADERDDFGRDINDDDERPDGAKPAPQVTHLLSISMKPPKPEAKSIRHLEASVPLNYPGVLTVVKLKGVVPVKYPPAPKPADPAAKPDAAEKLKDVQEGDLETAVEADVNEDEGRISNPKLAELGLTIRLETARFQGGAVMLTLVCSGDKSLLTRVQVYDALGKAWPTISGGAGHGGDSEYRSVSVLGRPQSLSLVLVVDGGGPSVKLPIVLDNLPVTPNEPKPLTPTPVKAPE